MDSGNTDSILNVEEIRDKKIPLMEVFGPTVQGEGALVGKISYFIRLGGCDYRCSWCDTMHAVTPELIHRNANWLTQEEVLEKFWELTPGKDYPLIPHQWVTISGGNPLMWDLAPLAWGLKLSGIKISVETQGSLIADWLDAVHLITCSPKGPSSGMLSRLDPKVLCEYAKRWPEKLILKIVIFSKEDLDFAEVLKREFPEIPFYLSSGTHRPTPHESEEETTEGVLESYRFLVNEFINRPALHGSVILPQMHVLVWGHRQGV